jgi:hypothetical protein
MLASFSGANDSSEASRREIVFTGWFTQRMNVKGAMPTKAKNASKRELVEPHAGDKRYVRRKPDGTFGKTVNVGKSLSADKRTKAKTQVPAGQGDRGDTKQ